MKYLIIIEYCIKILIVTFIIFVQEMLYSFEQPLFTVFIMNMLLKKNEPYYTFLPRPIRLIKNNTHNLMCITNFIWNSSKLSSNNQSVEVICYIYIINNNDILFMFILCSF